MREASNTESVYRMNDLTRRHRAGGFTLPELLMAAVISALLMAALAEGMSLFAK